MKTKRIILLSAAALAIAGYLVLRYALKLNIQLGVPLLCAVGLLISLEKSGRASLLIKLLRGASVALFALSLSFWFLPLLIDLSEQAQLARLILSVACIAVNIPLAVFGISRGKPQE